MLRHWWKCRTFVSVREIYLENDWSLLLFFSVILSPSCYSLTATFTFQVSCQFPHLHFSARILMLSKKHFKTKSSTWLSSFAAGSSLASFWVVRHPEQSKEIKQLRFGGPPSTPPFISFWIHPVLGTPAISTISTAQGGIFGPSVASTMTPATTFSFHADPVTTSSAFTSGKVPSGSWKPEVVSLCFSPVSPLSEG